MKQEVGARRPTRKAASSTRTASCRPKYKVHITNGGHPMSAHMFKTAIYKSHNSSGVTMTLVGGKEEYVYPWHRIIMMERLGSG